jgi:uncharacterized membrane protein
MTNQDYKNAALAALKGKWAPAVLATIVVFLLMAPYYAFYFGTFSITQSLQTDPLGAPSWYWIGYGAALLYLFLVFYPALVGYSNACKQLLLTGDDRLTENTFKIAFKRWLRNAWGMLLMGIKVALWTFVFIIPGFVKAFAYALTPYLLVDCPELSTLQCIKLSNRMMKGHKFDLFYLFLSFIGWGLLGILTLGIGYLWLTPYMSTAMASFYEDVKAQYLAGLDSAETPAAPTEAD